MQSSAGVSCLVSYHVGPVVGIMCLDNQRKAIQFLRREILGEVTENQIFILKITYNKILSYGDGEIK